MTCPKLPILMKSMRLIMQSRFKTPEWIFDHLKKFLLAKKNFDLGCNLL